jgi:hypothetical protein
MICTTWNGLDRDSGSSGGWWLILSSTNVTALTGPDNRFSANLRVPQLDFPWLGMISINIRNDDGGGIVVDEDGG